MIFQALAFESTRTRTIAPHLRVLFRSSCSYCQIALLIMSERFYLSLSPHSMVTCVEHFQMDNSLWSTHSGVPCSTSQHVSRESGHHILRVSSIVAPIFAEKYIHVVGPGLLHVAPCALLNRPSWCQVFEGESCRSYGSTGQWNYVCLGGSSVGCINAFFDG